jgi:hypothetical protein
MQMFMMTCQSFSSRNTRGVTAGPTVLTLGSSLGLYIVPTDQHKSFLRTLSSLVRTQENFSVGHSSQIAQSQARLTYTFFRDRFPKNKIHLIDMSTLLNLLSLRPRYHHPLGPGYHTNTQKL